jgi:glycosyltransferase involved in cell wall biosynthesis
MTTVAARKMRVSVLTTVYNRERSIIRAVRSILTQSHTDFEYVIIDDGSTDETTARIEELDDARIRLIPLPHRGRAAALNEGFRQCRGDVIAIQDSDDESAAARLEQQLRFLEAHPEVGMVGCHLFHRDETSSATHTVAFPENHEDILHLMPVTSGIPFNSSLIRSSVFEAAGPFQEHLAAAEDYDFQLRALRHCRFHNLPLVLNTVQRSADSMGVVQENEQNRIALEASRGFLSEEEREPLIFTSPRALRFARARSEYYLGDSNTARSLLFHLLLRSPFHAPYLRYFLPTLLGKRLLSSMRRSGLLHALSAPLRSRGLFRRHILP